MRTRARFDQWAATILVETDPELVDRDPDFCRKVLDLLADRWRLCQLILMCRTKRCTTGYAKTLSTGARSPVRP